MGRGAKWLTPEGAAKTYGVSRRSVSAAIKRGELIPRKNRQGYHLLSTREVTRWIDSLCLRAGWNACAPRMKP